LRCEQQADCNGGEVCCLTASKLDATAVLDSSFGQTQSQCASVCTGSIMCDPDAGECMCTMVVVIGNALHDASFYVCDEQ